MKTKPDVLALGPRASDLRPPAESDGLGGDLLGRLADFTIGTAVVLWHAAIATRDRRRRRPLARPWSSTR